MLPMSWSPKGGGVMVPVLMNGFRLVRSCGLGPLTTLPKLRCVAPDLHLFDEEGMRPNNRPASARTVPHRAAGPRSRHGRSWCR